MAERDKADRAWAKANLSTRGPRPVQAWIEAYRRVWLIEDEP